MVVYTRATWEGVKHILSPGVCMEVKKATVLRTTLPHH